MEINAIRNDEGDPEAALDRDHDQTAEHHHGEVDQHHDTALGGVGPALDMLDEIERHLREEHGDLFANDGPKLPLLDLGLKDFDLDMVRAWIEELWPDDLDLDGVLQVASAHPEDAQVDEITRQRGWAGRRFRRDQLDDLLFSLSQLAR